MRALLLACWLGLLSAACLAQPPAGPTRILFIGNSLTSSGDIPSRLAKLAHATGRKAEVEQVTANGYSLEDHWHDGRALATIRKKGWDVVVLQQGTSADAEGRRQLLEFSRRFAREIRAAGARPAISMSWPLVDRQRDFGAAIESHRRAAEAIDATLLPVGEAWLRALSRDKRLKLYGDTIHPSSLGGDLAVLTIYFALFPAGHQEFDDAYLEKIAAALEIPERYRELFFDVATRAIDEPLGLR